MQVAGQLQALLAEKARLASENARLAHENTSLQVQTCHLPLRQFMHSRKTLTYSSRLWQRWKEGYSIRFRKHSPQCGKYQSVVGYDTAVNQRPDVPEHRLQNASLIA